MQRNRRLFVALLACGLLALLTYPAAAVPRTDSPPLIVEPREQAILRAGPGHTHVQIDRLQWGDTITVTARSHSGLWAQVTIPRGDAVISGWVPAGYLMFADGASLDGLPVEATLPDADPSTVNSRTMAALYEVPVVPVIDEAMRDRLQTTYERGQANGSAAHTITKIGDSLIISEVYLLPLNADTDEHDLGPYTYLQPTLDTFHGAMIADSAAANIGLTSWALFDPLWASANHCESGETPLDCELRRSQPAFAFVAFGPNDVRSSTADEYAERITQIVETTLAAGTIPILSTFSAHPDADLWWQALDFNLALARIAEEQHVPLLNLWAAARLLPEYGLDTDDVHLLHSGFNTFYYPTGHEVYYGVSLQNLLALVMLDELRRALDLRADGG